MLDGTTVTNTTVNATAPTGQNNFFGTVRIPNYSKVAFELVSSILPLLPLGTNMLTCRFIGQYYLPQLPR